MSKIRVAPNWTYSRITGHLGSGTNFSGKRCRLRWSTQHWLGVYSLESRILFEKRLNLNGPDDVLAAAAVQRAITVVDKTFEMTGVTK